MTTAILQKWVRDPRSGEVHLPSEEVNGHEGHTQPRSHFTEGEVAGVNTGVKLHRKSE